MSNKTKKILAVILLLAVAAAAFFAYEHWGPPAQKRAELARRGEAAQQTETPEKPSPEPAAASEAPAPSPEAEEAAPAVTIYFTVVHGDGSRKEFSIVTDELTLRKALEQEKLIEGAESDWGLYVLTVDGETADESLQQWWCLTREDEMSMTGVDDTVIADGEHYAFTLTTGWDMEETAEEPEAAIHITLVVVHGDGSRKEFSIATNELTLRKALEQEKLIEGTESDWGLYVLTVDGETADESLQQWWCLTKDGEMSMTGVDDTVIADGEHYEFTLTTGW